MSPHATAHDTGHAPPQRRGLLTFIIDRIVMWLLNFPPERCTYTSRAVRIPISDGLNRIELAGDLLRPVLHDRRAPLGTLLQISPYGRGFPMRFNANAFAARGYQVLMVSSRGTFGSGGEFDPFRNEVGDGKGILEWMRKQSWYTGTFASIGLSYLSFASWAIMANAPKDMIAAVTAVGFHDASRVSWDTGALNLDIVRLADKFATQEEPWKALMRPKIDPIIGSVPLAQNVRNYLGDNCRWVDHMIAKSDMHDPHYAPMQLERALERINIPILIITGWYDIFLKQSIEQYIRLKERGVPVAMMSGPWSHTQCALSAKANRASFDWIDQHVGAWETAQRQLPVEYFVTGAEEWQRVPSYPPATTPEVFYLQDNCRLLKDPASCIPGSASFTFDPRDPTPTIGGNALRGQGAVNDSALAKRKDVLVFDSDPLENDFEFCGSAKLELEHCASQPYADIFVRVSDVEANGKSRNITEAYRRLSAARSKDETVKLDLNNASHRFLQGRKIRVMIAGGNFPQYARNLGVEDKSNTKKDMKNVEHKVTFSAAQLSKIQFPVVSG